MRRRYRRLGSIALWLVAWALLLIGLAGLIWADNARNRGIAEGFPAGPIPHSDVPQGGVNTFLLHLETREDIQRTLDMVRDAGLHFVRVHFPWEDIEKERKGSFRWETYDFIVDQARARGLELIIRLDRPPAWARTQALQSPTLQEALKDDPHATGPPDSYADYGDFVAAAVSRYRGRNTYYQLWNEPNLRHEWNYAELDPARFVELLCTGYRRARAADPAAVLLGPSLSPGDGLDWRLMNDLEYLDAMYRAGAGACFDIMSVQLYGLGQPPDEHRYVFPWRPDKPLDRLLTRPLDTRADVSRVVLLREIMERHGDTGKAVWVSELGWNSAPESIPAERRLTWGPPSSEQQKGEYIVALLRRAEREWPWMGAMCIWLLRYGGPEPNPDDPTPYFALVDRGWQELPAYAAVKQYLTGPRVLGPGVYQLDQRWAMREGQDEQSVWRLRFWGSDALLAIPAGSHVQLGLDGQGPWRFDPDPHGGGVPVAVGLVPGEHELSLHGALPPGLVLTVGNSRPLPWLWWLLPALALLALAYVTTRLLWLVYGGDPARLRLRAGWLRPIAPDRARAGGGRRARLWTALWSRGATPIVLALLTLALLALYRLDAHVAPSAAAALVFALLAFARPDLGLLAIPLTMPFYQRAKGFWDGSFGIFEKYLPLHEMVLVIMAGVTLAWWLAGEWGPLPGAARHPSPIKGEGPGTSAWAERLNVPAGAAQPDVPAGRLGYPLPPLVGGRVGDGGPKTLRRYAPHLLFAIAGVIGVLVALPESRRMALREWRWVIAEPLICYALLKFWLGRLRIERRLVWALLASGALVALIGLLQLAGRNLAPVAGVYPCFSQSVEITEGVRRATSVYCHSNNLGLYLGRIWPLAAALALLAYQRRDWPRMALWGALCGLLLLGLVASFSKGALLGAVVSALALAMLASRRRRLTQLAGALGLLIMLGGLAGPERFNPFGSSSDLRLSIWGSALKMLADHPLTGIGLDQFYYYYHPKFGYDYIGPEALQSGPSEINTAHAHNLALDLLLRLGPLGLLAFGWLTLRLLRGAIQGWRQGGPGAALALGIVGATVAGLAHGMFDHGYFAADLALFFWISLALAETAAASGAAAHDAAAHAARLPVEDDHETADEHNQDADCGTGAAAAADGMLHRAGQHHD